jgi:hypothetical protein
LKNNKIELLKFSKTDASPPQQINLNLSEKMDSHLDYLNSIMPEIPPVPEVENLDPWNVYFMSIRLQKKYNSNS